MTDKLTGTLAPVQTLVGQISVEQSMSGVLTVPMRVEAEKYKGTYSVRPRAEATVLPVKQLLMTDDIIIEPIPQNYGEILWNGSDLTII